MIKKINIFNYEAYYLDYLEGNLSDEDALVLLDFLEKHPELRMEDDELPTFETQEVRLNDLSFLKETDNADAVTTGSIEHFLIARHEQVLTEDKEREVAAFVLAHPEVETEDKLLASVYFTPDTAITFGDKSGLKHRGPIVMWPYYSGIAAAIIAAVFFLYQPSGTNEITETQLATNEIIDSVSENPETIVEAPVQEEFGETQTVGYTSEPSHKSDGVKQHGNMQLQEGTPIILRNSPMRPIVASLENRDVDPISTIYMNPEQPKVNGQDVAYVSKDNMVNPIEPITKLISEKTKTEVDFRQPKSKNKKGFYVKIGKFELERK